jgi:Fe2+ or Zn2+ uptake regulation protein
MSLHFTTDQTERFMKHCEANKVRVSAECKVLVSTLCCLEEPIGAVSLWLLMRSRSHRISMATVYRLPNLLHQTGFVRKEKIVYTEHALYQWQTKETIVECFL